MGVFRLLVGLGRGEHERAGAEEVHRGEGGDGSGV